MKSTVAPERRHIWNPDVREHIKELEARWNQQHPSLVFDEASGDDRSAADSEELLNLFDSLHDMQVVEARRPNVLLIGSRAKVDRAVNMLERRALPPILSCAPAHLDAVQGQVGTLLLRDAEFLSREDQAKLFGWLSASSSNTQVISTASVSLFPLVMQKVFSDALFNRLNQVSILVR